MTDKDILKMYPNNELEKLSLLDSLMKDWKGEISKAEPIIFYDDGKEYPPVDYFGSDGFLPNYFNQKQKVLFIGRETRYQSGGDLAVSLINSFKTGKNINSNIWRRLIYILYGIRNEGRLQYENIPYADEIAKKMYESCDFGFSIMNMSKYSNDRDDGAKADKELIQRFLKDSNLDKRNFILEEIEILEPDIIITGNLWDGLIDEKFLKLCFPNLYLIKKIENKANLYSTTINNRIIKLIDLYHFSSRVSDKGRDPDNDYFYDPTMELLYK